MLVTSAEGGIIVERNQQKEIAKVKLQEERYLIGKQPKTS